MNIAVQVSIYPLGGVSISPVLEKAFAIFRSHGLTVETGPMSTVLSGEDGAVFAAMRQAFMELAGEGEIVMTATFSNACPV